MFADKESWRVRGSGGDGDLLIPFRNVGPVIDHIILIARLLYDDGKRIRSENDGVLILDALVCPFMDPYNAAVWKSIGDFLSRPWWRRAWIMQESTAMSNIRLWYGSKNCRYVDVMGMDLQ